MKKSFVIAALISCTFSNISAQTLFTYGTHKVSTAEFLQAFNKNNSGTLAKSMTATDYLQLYTNFKLKVQAAKDLRLDTLPNLIQDANTFKAQIMDSYLTNEAGIKEMQREAFNRSQEDIHVVHYSIPESANAATLVDNLYKVLQKDSKSLNKASYPGLTIADVGYITVFSVPYVYENLIYNTAVGSYSAPILRNKKWHIFHTVARRPAVGHWKAAQILLAFPDGTNSVEKEAIKKRADSIYTLLQNGMLFEAAAEKFSNDRITNLTGGLMPTFGTGRYSNDFEAQVFALKNDGEMSKPFATDFGYHIVKRIAVIPVVKEEDDFNNQYELRQKMSNDSRMQIAKDAYATEVIKKTGWTVTNNVIKQKMITQAANINAAEEKIVIGKYKAGKSISGADWKSFLVDYWKTHENDGSLSNEDLWLSFEKEKAAEHYTENIDLYNASFSSQMQEFREGNLLFEIMEQKVWSQAGNDEAALKKYHATHAANFIWGASADAIVINCSSKELAEQTIAAMKKGKSLQALIEESKGNIFTDSSRFELDQLVDKTMPLPEPKTFSAAITNSENGGSFVYFIKFYPAGERKAYEASRGQVINEYQEILEKEWLSQLKKTYPVKYNTAEVNKLK